MAYIDQDTLDQSGFTDEQKARSPYAVVVLAGREGSGKTHWALSAPKPLLYQSTDFGEEGVIQKATGQILRPKRGDYKLDIPHELRAFVDRQETDQVRRQREGRLANFVHDQFYSPFFSDFQRGLEMGVRSVVWDNALDVWEYTRLSVYGREATNRDDLKAEANAKFREMVRMANVAKVNLIMINHLKTKFDSYFTGQGDLKWRPTAEDEMQGNDKTPYLVTMNLWTKFTPAVTKEGSEADPVWELVVKKCRDNPGAVGTTWPALPFVELMSFLIPGLTPEQWADGSLK
jgi:hypothetical protein